MKTYCLLVILSIFSFGCQRSALTEEKSKAKQELGRESPVLLEKVAFGSIILKEDEDTPVEEVRVNAAIVFVPKENSRKEIKRGVVLNYDGFDVYVYSARGGREFDSLPSAWGKDDLEKTITVVAASGETLDAAKSPAELQDAILRLTSKASISPLGASKRVDLIKANSFSGLLSGEFVRGERVSLIIRPKGEVGVCYYLEFRVISENLSRDNLLSFLSALKIQILNEAGPRQDVTEVGN